MTERKRVAPAGHSRKAAALSSGTPMKKQITYPVVKLTPTHFDYSGISPSIISALQAQAKMIKGMIAKTTAALIEIGNHLLAVKDNHLVEHGQFIDWVESEVGICKRTAQAYMAIARLAETKSATVALLPPSTAHRLAAISAPVEVIDHVIEQAAGGEIIPDNTVVEMIKEAKWKREQAKRKEQAAYRRSKAGREKKERRHQRWRQEQEEEKRQRTAKATATAKALIEEFGLGTVTKIAEALDYYVRHAIDKIAAEKRCAISEDGPLGAGQQGERLDGHGEEAGGVAA
jgi:Protein of unknown function (DUF3102)